MPPLFVKALTTATKALRPDCRVILAMLPEFTPETLDA